MSKYVYKSTKKNGLGIIIFFPEFQLDEGVVSQLMDIGFPLEGCKKAVFHTKNSGVEAAMNWVMEHMEDPGLWLS